MRRLSDIMASEDVSNVTGARQRDPPSYSPFDTETLPTQNHLKPDNVFSNKQLMTSSRLEAGGNAFYSKSDIYDFSSRINGLVSSRASSKLNKMSYIHLPKQEDIDRLRTKINRDGTGGSSRVVDQSSKLHRNHTDITRHRESIVDLSHSLQKRSIDHESRFAKNYNRRSFDSKDKYADDPVPSARYYKPYDGFKPTSFLSERESPVQKPSSLHPPPLKLNEGIKPKDTSESTTERTSQIIKTAYDNQRLKRYAQKKNSSLILVEVNSPQPNFNKNQKQSIRFVSDENSIEEHPNEVSITEKLERLKFENEITNVDRETENCMNFISEISESAELAKKRGEDMIRCRQSEIGLLESRFKKELMGLESQLEFEKKQFEELLNQIKLQNKKHTE